MMEQQTKIIDAKKILANKEKITVNVPRYIYDDLKAYSDLTGSNTTEIVTDALFRFFRSKTLTNDTLIGYGNLFFKLPLSKTFKSDAIANRVKLNADFQTTETTEPITIKTVTNNLDVFNGDTYYAGSELAKRNVKHIGLDFVIIPTAIELTNSLDYHKLNIDVTGALYVFYYEIASTNLIDVYLIDSIDAVNRLAGVNSINTNEKLVSCLQDLERTQTEIDNAYADEIMELHRSNKTVSNAKLFDVKDRYTKRLLDSLKELSIKYNSDNIKLGSEAVQQSYRHLKDKINQQKQEQQHIGSIIKNQ